MFSLPAITPQRVDVSVTSSPTGQSNRRGLGGIGSVSFPMLSQALNGVSPQNGVSLSAFSSPQTNYRQLGTKISVSLPLLSQTQSRTSPPRVRTTSPEPEQVRSTLPLSLQTDWAQEVFAKIAQKEQQKTQRAFCTALTRQLKSPGFEKDREKTLKQAESKENKSNVSSTKAKTTADPKKA